MRLRDRAILVIGMIAVLLPIPLAEEILLVMDHLNTHSIAVREDYTNRANITPILYELEKNMGS